MDETTSKLCGRDLPEPGKCSPDAVEHFVIARCATYLRRVLLRWPRLDQQTRPGTDSSYGAPDFCPGGFDSH